jgi:hypothetical protein
MFAIQFADALKQSDSRSFDVIDSRLAAAHPGKKQESNKKHQQTNRNSTDQDCTAFNSKSFRIVRVLQVRGLAQHSRAARTPQLAKSSDLIGGLCRATEVWVHGNFPLIKQPLRYVAAVSVALTPATKLS